MYIKNLILVILLFSVFSPGITLASDLNSKKTEYEVTAKQYVENFIRTSYNTYYNFDSLNLSIKDSSLNSNEFKAEIDVSMVKILKAKNVNDLPYVKGLNKQLNTYKVERSAVSSQAENLVNTQINEFSEYIGKKQEQNDTFRISFPIIQGNLDLNNANIEFLDYLDFVPAQAFVPAVEANITQKATNDLKNDITTNKEFTVQNQPSITAAATFKYNRVAARDYANKWTNNQSGRHPETYNPNYPAYENDCANFVSQAMRAGGIPTDAAWKSGTTPWINTGLNVSNGLKQYMVNTKGYFYQSTKTTTAAGGFIFAKNYSHVMFVVANDGVSLLYSSHTNDRLKSSFAGFSDSEYSYYYINSAYL